jgi:FtsP/CotA-like multicopper oxidase with cupredoxin domain
MKQHSSRRPTPAHQRRTAATGIVQIVDLEAASHSWETSPGVVVHGYAFNGQVPGPTIEATVGDTLAVRFSNQLSKPTTLHWHGLRIPAAIAGGELATHLVESGISVEYRFDLPHPGTFWYHPQVDENAQPQPGLYGALIVRSPEELVLDGERVLVIQDLEPNQVGQSGALTPPPPRSGRGKGHILLVNGLREPQMMIAAGHRERWRLVNTTARHLRLSLAGRPFGVIDTNCGLVTAADEAEEAQLAAGETLDLVIGPFTRGDTISLGASPPYQPGAGQERQHRLAILHVGHPDGQTAFPPST